MRFQVKRTSHWGHDPGTPPHTGLTAGTLKGPVFTPDVGPRKGEPQRNAEPCWFADVETLADLAAFIGDERVIVRTGSGEIGGQPFCELEFYDDYRE